MKRLNKATVTHGAWRAKDHPMVYLDTAGSIRLNEGAVQATGLQKGDRLEVLLPDDDSQTIYLAKSKQGFAVFPNQSSNSLLFRSMPIAAAIRQHLGTEAMCIRFKIKPEQEPLEGVLCWALNPINL